MSQNWRDIWNRRALPDGSLTLDTLIKLDGFDVGAGRIETEDWRNYVATIAAKLGLRDGASVFEVGCGSGAFLYALQERYTLSLGGIDYAGGLIAAARCALPAGHFEITEASALDTTTPFDFVIANGVFHYFTLDYASEVLRRMAAKARCAVAILEIPDAQTQEASEALRRNTLTQAEYEKKYAGLEHTYFQSEWFTNQAAALGLRCEAFAGCVPNYAQNQFRFGVMIRKQPHV